MDTTEEQRRARTGAELQRDTSLYPYESEAQRRTRHLAAIASSDRDHRDAIKRAASFMDVKFPSKEDFSAVSDKPWWDDNKTYSDVGYNSAEYVGKQSWSGDMDGRKVVAGTPDHKGFFFDGSIPPGFGSDIMSRHLPKRPGRMITPTENLQNWLVVVSARLLDLEAALSLMPDGRKKLAVKA